MRSLGKHTEEKQGNGPDYMIRPDYLALVISNLCRELNKVIHSSSGMLTINLGGVSYLPHDVSLTASVTVLLQIARVTHGSSAVRHLAGRIAHRQAALEVNSQLSQAL